MDGSLDGGRGVMDFDEFHVREIPRLLAAGQGVAAARDIGDGRSLALHCTGGAAYTYRSVAGDMAVYPVGSEGADDIVDVVVELDADAFDDLPVARFDETVLGRAPRAAVSVTRGIRRAVRR